MLAHHIVKYIGRTCTAIAIGGFVSGAAIAQQAADSVAPEGAGQGSFTAMSPQITAAFEAKDAGEPVIAQNWMVAAANPHAVQAGADVLARGGTAADALVAVQAMLGLVEPQSSGLGHAVLQKTVHRNVRSQQLHTRASLNEVHRT